VILSDDDLMAYLGLSSMDSLAKFVQVQAENHVKDFLGWKEIEQNTWTEYYPIHEGYTQTSDPQYVVNNAHTMAVPMLYYQPRVIQLRHIPVRSITNFWEDPTGFFGQPTGSFSAPALTQGNDYFLKVEEPGISWTGQLVRLWYWFSSMPGSQKVQYVSGFTQPELAGRYSIFKTAIAETAAELYMRGKALSLGHLPNIASESDGGGVSVSYYRNRLGAVGVPDNVAEYLQEYVFYGEHAL